MGDAPLRTVRRLSGQVTILRGEPQRALAKRIIDAAPVDAVVSVKAPTRTLDQNSLLWAMLSDVSRAAPDGRRHTPDVWKALFLSACGHAVQFETGLDGHPFPIGFRSSRLTKGQMSDLIEFISSYGAEKGVKWTGSAA